MKNFKSIVFVFICPLLFSCAPTNNDLYTQDDTVQTMFKSVNTEEKDENTQEQILKDALKNSNKSNASKQMKRVERHRVLVKPLMNLSTEPQSFSHSDITEFFDAVKKDNVLEDGKKYPSSVKTLLENYKNILTASNACCEISLISHFKSLNLSNDQVRALLDEDNSKSSVQNKCMLLSDDELNTAFNNKVLNSISKNIKNICICNNKSFIRKNINNFYRLYNADSKFYKKPLIYKYKDKFGNIIEDNMNEMILNTAFTLESCL